MSDSRTMKRHIIVVSIILAFVVIMSTEARAMTYSWAFVENNTNNYIGDQFTLDVADEGSGQVRFTLGNASWGEASSITGIYFDDGALLGISTLVESGVDFDNPASSPAELKGAQTVDPIFETSAGFSAQAEPSPFHNGVQPGDSLGIIFDLQSTATFATVLDAIALGFTHPDDYAGEGNWYDKSLRIGINVQAIGEDGDSDSYILTPIPPSVIIGLLGIGIAGIKLRKFA